MKNSIIYILSLLVTAALFFACEKQTTPEPIRIQHPEDQSEFPRDDAYYARLRAYKQTDHKLAFGWYGSWSAIEATEQCRLRSVPDSMDIISIWSQWHSLSDAQMADKAFIQQTRGTKVVFCISAKDVPAEFKEDGQITDASLVAYAKAWGKDSMDKYQYDGMDIDFETAIDHQGPLNTTPGLFKKFCEQLSQYIGPKSSTGRLFLIDGNIDALDNGIAELCNYGVSQAYSCSSASNLVTRTNSAANRGWKPEQLIFTENFESYWKSGGVSFSNLSGVTFDSSLIGMADFALTETAAGFGSYHMEYEYGHQDMPYKFMRRAIQLANPAPKGDFSKNLVSINETDDETFRIVSVPSGAVVNGVETSVTAHLSSLTGAETNLKLGVDNSLVAGYNDYYYTEYKPFDTSRVVFSGPLHFAAGTQTSDNAVTISIVDFHGVEDGDYLIPIRIDFSGVEGLSANENKQVKYLFVTKTTTTVDVKIAGSDNVLNSKLSVLSNGTVSGTVSHQLSAELSLDGFEDLSLSLVTDNALVAAYNQKNGTNYAAVDAKNVSISGKLEIAKGTRVSAAPVTVSMPDLTKLPADESMIAVRLDLGSKSDYKANETLGVRYILITRMVNNIEAGATAVSGTPVADMTGWVYSVEGQGTGAIGGFDDPSSMFNGNNTEMGWYSSVAGMRKVTVDMASIRTIAGWRMGMVLGSASYKTLKLHNIQTSTDGTTWKDQSAEESVAIGSPDAGNWQYVKFIEPVACRYVRMNYNQTSGSASGGFIGSNEFNAIAANN